MRSFLVGVTVAWYCRCRRRCYVLFDDQNFITLFEYSSLDSAHACVGLTRWQRVAWSWMSCIGGIPHSFLKAQLSGLSFAQCAARNKILIGISVVEGPIESSRCMAVRKLRISRRWRVGDARSLKYSISSGEWSGCPCLYLTTMLVYTAKQTGNLLTQVLRKSRALPNLLKGEVHKSLQHCNIHVVVPTMLSVTQW